MATYTLALPELTPHQRRLFNRIGGLSKFKFPKLSESLTEIGRSHLLLAKHGWFTSLFLTSFVTSIEAATCFLPRKSDSDKGNRIMVEHYREMLDEIQKWAADDFPSRRAILRKAFNAHRQGDYELSIPVMLAQADGIGVEIFGFSPYEPGKRIFKNHINQKVDPGWVKLFRNYFSCVTEELEIKKSTKSNTQAPFPLSRHLVLHGVSTDYASEINALKTVSWLQYIISFKSVAK